jgi:hypothetical protein
LTAEKTRPKAKPSSLPGHVGAKSTSSPEPEREPAPGRLNRELALRADADPAGSGSRALSPSAVTAGLKLALERDGRPELWSILRSYPCRMWQPPDCARLLPGNPAPALTPFQAAFGPLRPGAAEQLAAATSRTEPDLRGLLASETAQPRWDLWVIYENDGAGLFPNFGSGSDQGRTAALYVVGRKRDPAPGLSRIGVTPIEMTTPMGTLDPGAPRASSSTYRTPPGPYSGVVSLDVGVTVYRHGGTSVEVSGSAGADSREWGKLVQDAIHTKVSNSPLFPWPDGTKPLAEMGVAGHYSLRDLLPGDFRGLTYAGRLELDESLITGTRRTEGSLRARFTVQTAALRTPLGTISLEFSPLGLMTRAFLRYNDGRVASLAGVEAGVSSSFMVNLGRVGLGLAGEMVMSTDPAFQTPLEAGQHPAVTSVAGWVMSGPAGHHGTGQLIVRIAL